MTQSDLNSSYIKVLDIFKEIHFNEEKENRELKELALYLENPEVYSDIDKCKEINSKIKSKSYIMSLYKKINSFLEIVDYTIKENNEKDYSECYQLLDDLEKDVEELKDSLLLNNKYDSSDAIITIHAGAGGTEACDWAEMLYRMYMLYCQKRKYSIKTLDRLDGEEAGIKSITFKVEGLNAYGYLKSEKGIHRLIRISPFDSNKRRHTSFSSVEVLPDFSSNEVEDIILKEEDLDITTCRSSGAGGQNINKVESKVRILHKPTGIIVTCQEERSQKQNREKGLEKLKSILALKKEEEKLEELSQLKGKLKKIEWGSQIRSYVFCPYTLVKDHRTGFETSNIQSVMDGNIQDLSVSYLNSIN